MQKAGMRGRRREASLLGKLPKTGMSQWPQELWGSAWTREDHLLLQDLKSILLWNAYLCDSFLAFQKLLRMVQLRDMEAKIVLMCQRNRVSRSLEISGLCRHSTGQGKKSNLSFLRQFLSPLEDSGFGEKNHREVKSRKPRREPYHSLYLHLSTWLATHSPFVLLSLQTEFSSSMGEGTDDQSTLEEGK